MFHAAYILKYTAEEFEVLNADLIENCHGETAG
jgi:hypothetical protein